VERIQPASGALADAYIAGCRVGELRLQCCSRCGVHQFYPRIMCASCLSDELEWVAATGRGEIISFTVVRRPISKAYEAPYVVALIQLQEGPTLMSHVVDCAPEAVAVGLPVQVAFAPWSESVTLPVFTLDSQRGNSS
tara:strand:- start:79596 stop:80009 length:414 start_codon:yes stop_codon:yes gene_type:complete